MAGLASADEKPTSLTCRSNAKAWREYLTIGLQSTSERGGWNGQDERPFGIATTERPVVGMPLREKVFSGLQTETPVIRSITPQRGVVPEDAVEFKGRVLLRSATEVFITWSNDMNKVWLAAVDLANRKVVVTHTVAGATSLVGELETLDCK
jgi:hypothetical protein